MIGRHEHTRKSGEAFLKVLGVRGITLRHLLEAYRKMKNTDGIQLLNGSDPDLAELPIPKLVIGIQPERFRTKSGRNVGPIKVETPNIPKQFLKFQWFKETNGQLETIQNNLTAKTSELTLVNAKPEDGGRYKCQVICDLTKENIISNQCCKVTIENESPFDLKIALIIGNANYITWDCDICRHSDWNFDNLQVTDGLAKLKVRLEQLDYIVLSFLDLDAEGFLRAVRYFKEICEGAKSISIFIYVGGHGFHNQYDDHLVPIDVLEDNHAMHQHLDFNTIIKQNINVDPFRSIKLRWCSLKNLFENLVQLSHDNRLVYVTCIWDLCRAYSKHFESEPFYKDIGNLYYQVIYGCNVGEAAYEMTSSDPSENGSIVLNKFLAQLKKNASMNQIWSDVQNDIEEFKRKDPEHKIVNGIHVHQKVFPTNLTFSVKGNANEHFKRKMDALLSEYHIFVE